MVRDDSVNPEIVKPLHIFRMVHRPHHNFLLRALQLSDECGIHEPEMRDNEAHRERVPALKFGPRLAD